MSRTIAGLRVLVISDEVAHWMEQAEYQTELARRALEADTGVRRSALMPEPVTIPLDEEGRFTVTLPRTEPRYTQVIRTRGRQTGKTAEAAAWEHEAEHAQLMREFWSPRRAVGITSEHDRVREFWSPTPPGDTPSLP